MSESREAVRRRVRIDLPSWMWGGKPSGLLEMAQLHAWKVGGSTFDVQTEEAYMRRVAPQLVTVDHIAGPEHKKPAFDVIGELARRETISAADAVEDGLLAQHVSRAQERGDIAGAVSANQMLLAAAAPNQVATLLRELFDNLRQVEIEEDASQRPFANAGIHLIRRSPVLLARLKLPSVLLKVPTTDSATARSTMLQRHELGEHVFSTSDNLRDGHYLFDAYTGPLLGALTPFVWGFAIYRELGVIVATFGTPIAGASGDAAEPLQVLPTQSGRFTTPAPDSSPLGSGAALRWWVEKLDALFAVISDPGVFAGDDGRYKAANHLHALLTVEQLFRRVASIQASHRDLHARRVLFFSALDTFEKLTGKSINTLTNLRLAKRALDDVAERMDSSAQEVLIPAAERALLALEAVQRGFTRVDENDCVVVQDVRGPRTVSLDTAAGHYIKMLRNATHGHGGVGKDAVRVTSLLEQHSGDVPHELGLLAYLWLLDLLSRPEDLRRRLAGMSLHG